MEKKGFWLLVGLFVLVAAACATTSSTPSLTASEAKEVLLGKWSGSWESPEMVSVKAADIIMVIKKVDLDQKIIEINYGWSSRTRGSGNEDCVGEYMLPDKFKIQTKSNNFFEFQLKDGVLWGTCKGGTFPGSPIPGGKIKMAKVKE